jgi:catechol 2,3-dioxygenase-like lactoylglutathione lyase family enzyme
VIQRAETEKRTGRARVSVGAMLTQITHTFISVLDQDEALDFYVNKLGMEVRTDADLGEMRFLTVAVPGHPVPEIVLMKPGPPAYDDQTAAEIRQLVTKGGAAGVIFGTEDCHATYERLQAAGVEFTQEPIERFYGTDCACRDPFGNPIRITQPPDGPVVVPEPGSAT